jgi:hypothetical protein
MASADSSSPVSSLAPRAPDFTAKARNVIFIFLQGGPSQVDTFDPKPELSRLDGQLVPPSFLQGMLGLAQIKAEEAKLMGSRRGSSAMANQVLKYRICSRMSPIRRRLGGHPPLPSWSPLSMVPL